MILYYKITISFLLFNINPFEKHKIEFIFSKLYFTYLLVSQFLLFLIFLVVKILVYIFIIIYILLTMVKFIQDLFLYFSYNIS